MSLTPRKLVSVCQAAVSRAVNDAFRNRSLALHCGFGFGAGSVFPCSLRPCSHHSQLSYLRPLLPSSGMCESLTAESCCAVMKRPGVVNAAIDNRALRRKPQRQQSPQQCPTIDKPRVLSGDSTGAGIRPGSIRIHSTRCLIELRESELMCYKVASANHLASK